jgi:hypothetical protein
MKNIDFLPEVYRERIALRQARVWWGIVVLIFGTAIGSTAGAQYLLKRSIKQQFDDLESTYAKAQAQVKRLGQLQADNRTAGQWAGLVTYLEQPWPRSQLIAEVIRPLKGAIRLTEMIVAEEEVAHPTAEDSGPRRRKGASEPSSKLAPALADLEELRSTHDYKRPIIEITGTVEDVAVLHEYVAALGRSSLVASAQIKSLETTASGGLDRPTTFTVRLVFRPSHGQPDSEQTSAGTTAQSNQATHGGTDS